MRSGRRIAFIAVGGLLTAAAATAWICWPSPTRLIEIPVLANRDSIDSRLGELIDRSIAEIGRDRRNAGAWLKLGMIYEANGEFPAARASLAQATALDESDARAWYHLAQTEAELGDQTAAMSDIDRVIRLDDANVAAHVHRGTWLFESGRLDEAWESFQRATRIDPAEMAGWLGLARIQMQRGEPQQAVETLERVLGLPRQRNVAYARQLLASAYRSLGRLQEADTLTAQSPVEEISMTDPWMDELEPLRVSFSARYREASALVARGRFDQAIELYEALRKEQPEHLGVLTGLGAANVAAGRLDAGFTILQEVLRHNPDSFAALFNLALAYAQQCIQSGGDGTGTSCDSALASLDRALVLNPSFARAHGLRGDLLARRNQLEAAIESFRLAGSCDARNSLWPFRIGVAYCQLARWTDAIEPLRQATQMSPSFANAFSALGVASMNAGRYDEAESALATARQLRPADKAILAASEQLRRLKARPANP